MMNGQPPMPAGAPPEEEAPSAAAPKKAPKDLVVGINSDLMQLVEMLSASPETKAEAQAGAQIVQMYQSLVDSLGQSPGAAKPQAPSPGGTVSTEAGANPNARPM